MNRFDEEKFYEELDAQRKKYTNELNRIGNHVPAHLAHIVPVIGMNTVLEVLAAVQIAIRNSIEPDEDRKASEKKPEEPVEIKRGPGRPKKEEETKDAE